MTPWSLSGISDGCLSQETSGINLPSAFGSSSSLLVHSTHLLSALQQESDISLKTIPTQKKSSNGACFNILQQGCKASLSSQARAHPLATDDIGLTLKARAGCSQRTSQAQEMLFFPRKVSFLPIKHLPSKLLAALCTPEGWLCVGG